VLPLREHGWDVFADNDGNLHVYSYGGGTTGGRTGEDGRGENGISKMESHYYGLDSKGDAEGVVILHDWEGNQLRIPITIAQESCKDDPLAAFNKVVGAFDTIIKADPQYFIPLFGGAYDVQVMPGKDIASIYNARNKQKVKILGGLHSPDKTTDNKATIYIAGEILKEDKYYGYFVKDRHGIDFTVPLQVWEAIAHEFGHQLDLLKYGRTAFFNILTYDGREILAINRLNRLRMHPTINRIKEIYDPTRRGR